MISCELMGRLGNELFQIAACYGLARKHNDKMVFPNFTSAKFFKGKLDNIYYISQVDPATGLTKDGRQIPLEEYSVKHEEIFDTKFIHDQSTKQFHYYKRPYLPGTLYKGYYQSAKFFEGFDTEIKSLFEIKPEYQKRVSDEIRDNNATCSIHVRRGDYLTLEQYHPTQTMRYFDSAIALIKEKVGKETQFLVFSDDIPWCKENFNYPNIHFQNGSMIDDFSLMVDCDHHIISNSSFSWWTSYLSKPGITVAPKRWFGPILTHDTRDIYQPDWIQL